MFFSQKTINGSGCEKQQSALSHEASAWKSWKFNDLGQYAFFNKVELTFFLFFFFVNCDAKLTFLCIEINHQKTVETHDGFLQQ